MNFIHSFQNFTIDMLFSLRPDMCYIFCTDGFLCVSRVQRLVWEALSATGYTTLPTDEVSEFESLGFFHCRVILTVLPHPDHADWLDLSFVH
jgi:hypothetical protein